MMTPPLVLLVEDEALSAQSLKASLEADGFRVALARTGPGAVSMANALGPDVVVMDVHLPGEMDGVSAATKIQEHREVPVVFLTGHPEVVSPFSLVHPRSWLLKPALYGHVKTAIESALAIRPSTLP
jgi:CheY-like chemotaxis protein